MNSILTKTFKELTRKQLYSILKLRVDIFVVEQNCPYPELDDEDQDAIHLFIEDQGKIVSYLRIITTQPIIRIGRVVTDADFRGKKLSSLLMEEAMRFIQKYHSQKSIVLSAQEHLQSFYGKFGFKPITEMYLEDGIPHVDMEFQS